MHMKEFRMTRSSTESNFSAAPLSAKPLTLQPQPQFSASSSATDRPTAPTSQSAARNAQTVTPQQMPSQRALLQGPPPGMVPIMP
jgi:hypothetical protein